MENKSKVGKKYPTYMTISNKYRFLQPSKQLQLKLAVTNFDTRNLLDIKFHLKFIRPFYCQITSDNKQYGYKEVN